MIFRERPFRLCVKITSLIFTKIIEIGNYGLFQMLWYNNVHLRVMIIIFAVFIATPSQRRDISSSLESRTQLGIEDTW